MPEMPEIQAHAERLTETFGGHVLTGFRPLRFTALKTALPAPDEAYGLPLRRVGRRGKYLLLEFEPITFVVHLMQGGRLVPDTKLAATPRGGQARFLFDGDPPGLLLTEAGTERRAGVWCVPTDVALASPPLDVLGPEAVDVTTDELLERLAIENRRVHGFLRDQRAIAGIGRRLANEICHHAQLSPFTMTRRIDRDGAERIVAAIAATVHDGLTAERARADMSSSKDRPSAVHGRAGEPCGVCGDEVRAVEYSGYTVNYCATCQTGGKLLADNTTSKFLK
jgi:formamidopyrimidine-DNA glycosylase